MAEGLRIGIMLPTVGRVVSDDAVRSVALHAEAVGVHSLWVSDHVTMPVRSESPFPFAGRSDYPVPADRAYLEAFTTLSWVGGQTSRVTLGTGVCVAPYRHRILLAKILGSLEMLCPGRLVLGVGVGWLQEEFAALGLRFSDRHRATESTIEFLRSCARREGAVEADGVELYVRPHPAAGLPIWIGGNGPVARRRVARIGDGWLPAFYGCSPETVTSGRAEIAELRDELGHAAAAFDVALYIEVHLAEAADGDRPWEIGHLSGPPSSVVDVLETYRDHGVTEVLLGFGGGADRRRQQLETLLENGLPMAPV
jgi:probable F420-dependent oxidoreductase